MNNRNWLLIFLLVLAAHLAGILLEHTLTQQVTKAILIPVLVAWVLTGLKKFPSSLKTWLLIALFFSWVGDILLMFQERDALFFLLGLSSFLLAHIGYIVLFHKIRVREAVKSNPWFLVLVVIYYAGLISWLGPYLGDMKLPVRIYGVVISFMFLLALHMLYIKDKVAGKYMMGGAALFIISDSVLAINKFYQPFEMAGFIIMLTYGLAQLCIVYGAMKYIRGQTS
jgi:uncharacterized membrane protein YhhN